MKQQILNIAVKKDGEVIASFENCSAPCITACVELYHSLADKIILSFKTIEVGVSDSPAQ